MPCEKTEKKHGARGEASGCCGNDEAAKQAAASDGKASSCCSGASAAMTVEAASSPGCCSSNGSARSERDSCCASKKDVPAVNGVTGKPKVSCSSSKGKKCAGSCCSSGAVPAAAIQAKSSCCSTNASGSSCSEPSSAKSLAVAPPSTGCCSSKNKNAKKTDSCCAPKEAAVPVVASKSCGGSTGNTDSCCSSTTNGASVQRELQKASKPSDLPTVRLSIGGMTCSGCCTRIEKFMESRAGITDVNVSLLTGRGIFEYDPQVVSAQAIEDMVVGLGFSADEMPNASFVSIVLHVGREDPPQICAELLGMQGVMSAKETNDVSPSFSPMLAEEPQEHAILVEYDPEATGARQIVRQLSSVIGFQVYVSSPRPLAVQNEEAEVKKFKSFLWASFLLSLPILVMEYLLPIFESTSSNPAGKDIVTGLSIKDAIGMACATPILVIIAFPIHESAFLALRYGSRVTMDVLISLSSCTAYTFSVVTVVAGMLRLNPERSETFFEVTALLITLILLGRYIEKLAKARASNSVDALRRIQAKTAILLETTGGNNSKSMKESDIDILLVEREDLLKVLPGARIPTDGIVVDGASSVDESMVTGESRKVAKEPGSTVIGGTINSRGVLVMRVTHTISESMLARIVSLVDEAQSSKCASQSVADVVASYFTTFIISVSMVMFVVWYHLARSGSVSTQGWSPFPFALRFAITILVISCPCAISLAVPTAIMVSTTIGSQFGVLFKGGCVIEALEKVDVVMFDKTGTLTSGSLSVVDSIVSLSHSPEENTNKLWSYIAAVETNSEHAIGKALASHAQHQLNVASLTVTKFASIPGCGVQGRVDGHQVSIGSLKWMQDVLKIAIPVDLHMANSRFQQQGYVVISVAISDQLAAVIALRDTPRPEARLVIEQLRRQNIETWIVTGDQRDTALSVADMLGVPEVNVIADALPHQKIEQVCLLQSKGKNVAFVGDGVNDAPALAMAHVGIAVGAGTDVAIESADLVLVKDDLRDLLNAINLSQATSKMIRWNFAWGFMYNVLMMPVACGALYPHFGISIPPAMAGLSELLSSVPVILFSLLLNCWRPPYKDHGAEEIFVAIQVDTTNAGEKTPLVARK